MYGKKVKLRLTFLTVLILSLGLTIYLVLVSLKENVVYFLSPTEIKALSELKKDKIRIGGMVKENSIVDISVIIPTRNEEKYIEKCIKSLLNCRSIKSDSFNVQFIIVDGMSTDKTIKIIEEKFRNLNLKIFKNQLIPHI